MIDVLIPELNVPFTFARRPSAVPPDLRPLWRVGLVLLILKNCCRGGRSSFARLHVLNWASRTQENQRALLDALDDVSRPDAVVVRIEPALNRAVDLGTGNGLFNKVTGGKVELTARGLVLARALDLPPEMFERERLFLHTLGRRVTEQFVDRMFASYKGRAF